MIPKDYIERHNKYNKACVKKIKFECGNANLDFEHFKEYLRRSKFVVSNMYETLVRSALILQSNSPKITLYRGVKNLTFTLEGFSSTSLSISVAAKYAVDTSSTDINDPRYVYRFDIPKGCLFIPLFLCSLFSRELEVLICSTGKLIETNKTKMNIETAYGTVPFIVIDCKFIIEHHIAPYSHLEIEQLTKAKFAKLI